MPVLDVVNQWIQNILQNIEIVGKKTKSHEFLSLDISMAERTVSCEKQNSIDIFGFNWDFVAIVIKRKRWRMKRTLLIFKRLHKWHLFN